MSSTAKKTYGDAPASPPWIPPRPSGVWIMKPLPEGPGSKRHPNSALVEGPAAVGVLHAQLDEGHASTGAVPTAASRRAAETSRWRRPKASAKRKAMRLRKHGR